MFCQFSRCLAGWLLQSRKYFEVMYLFKAYCVKTDKRSGIVNDPNNPADEEAILRLLEQVIWVSLETVERVKRVGEVVLK